jgi:AcrR family transcriptional regulator
MGIADWWPLWLVLVLAGFAVPEFLAIRNKVRGDTLSERLRAWFHVDTPGGGASWLAVWSALAVTLGWLLGHIAGWWP